MKLNKTLGRLATGFLATAMLAAFTAVPASAAGITAGTQGDGSTAIGNLEFKTELWLPTGVEVPAGSITFTLTPDEPDRDEAVDIQDTGDTVAVTKTTDGKTATGTVTLSAADTSLVASAGVDKVSKLTKDVSIDLSTLSFSEVGVYKYNLSWQITPTAAASGDFTPSDSPRTVYLYVARTDETPTYAVTGAVMVNGETYNKANKSNGTITNYYMLDGDPDDTTPQPTPKANELTLANQVDGIMGNRTEAFDFTVEIQANTGKNFNIVYEKYDAAQTKWVTDSSKPAINLTDDDIDGVYTTTVSLTHNQRIHVYGLVNGDKYTITEDPKYLDEGYEAPSVSGGPNADATEATFTNANVDITYTNTRNAIAPTGLVMNVAPYALLVLVAVGAGFVFLRKREED